MPEPRTSVSAVSRPCASIVSLTMLAVGGYAKRASIGRAGRGTFAALTQRLNQAFAAPSDRSETHDSPAGSTRSVGQTSDMTG